MKPVLFLLAAACLPAIAQPTITAVLDGAAYTQNIAQGSVFVFKGKGLSAAGNVTVSGLYQLAALLPSATPVGLYDLRVTNGAANSAPVRLSIVFGKPGIVTASGDGSGPA